MVAMQPEAPDAPEFGRRLTQSTAGLGEHIGNPDQDHRRRIINRRDPRGLAELV